MADFAAVTPTVPVRARLPDRRAAMMQTLDIDGCHVTASVGFDHNGRPREVFLSGAKVGSSMAAILEDASVVISICLQHNIPASALAKSVARLPAVPLAPPYFDQPSERQEDHGDRPASVIGAALDLVAAFENGEVDGTASHS